MKKINCTKVFSFLLIVTVCLCILGFVSLCVERALYPRHYREYVEKYSRLFSVPEAVVYSVIKVESDFDKQAVSSRGACGLMQLMPTTHAWLAETLGEDKKDIFEEEENIKYGVYYLSMLYKKYENWTHTLCAYNAGEGNVDKWLKEERFEIPFAETQNYVNKLEVVIGKYKSLYY